MHTADPAREPRLYHELADWWPLVSRPDAYAVEAAFYRRVLVAACRNSPETMLELGAGGGHNACHLKRHFRITLADLSRSMLGVSERLNPECHHVQGDMRELRLGETFDTVFIHDAIMYMTTPEDLRATFETAWAHTRPGGAVLIAPDFVRESFRTGTRYGGHDEGDRSLRYAEWVRDLEVHGRTYRVDFAFLLRDGDNPSRVVEDSHEFGLFSRAEWIGHLEGVGFDVQAVACEPGQADQGQTHVFVGTRSIESIR